MKLKDIISRTSLRNRSVGNLELPEQHVFEVNDLVVPAGTNWHTEPFTLGSVQLPRLASGVVSVAMQVADVSVLGDDSLYIEWDDAEQGGTLAAAGLAGVQDPTWTTAMEFAHYKPLRISVPGPPPDSITLQANLWLGQPLATPLHILYARASFLAI